MKSKAAIWTISGLFIAAMMVAVLGFAGVGATSQHGSAVSAQAKTADSAQAADKEKSNGAYQTTRVFWPIWSGQR